MNNIKKEHIAVSARKGAELSRCIADAVTLSMQQAINVVLTHNKTKYIIDYSAVIISIPQESVDD